MENSVERNEAVITLTHPAVVLLFNLRAQNVTQSGIHPHNHIVNFQEYMYVCITHIQNQEFTARVDSMYVCTYVIYTSIEQYVLNSMC